MYDGEQMAFITPGSLQISPPTPTTNDTLTFTFHAEKDAWDTWDWLGFDTTFYILFKESTSNTWRELGAWKCSNCFTNLGAEDRHFLGTITTENITTPGTYDFLVIDYGIYMGKLPPYDTTKTAKLRTSINPYVDLTKPYISVTTNPRDAEIWVNGVRNSTGSATLTGTGTVTIEAKKIGYITQSTIQTFTNGTLVVPEINLVPCTAGMPGCYVAPSSGGVGTQTTKCEGFNKNGAFDPMCIMDPANAMYLYGAIGIILLIVLYGGSKK
jgi:hypothetical protein